MWTLHQQLSLAGALGLGISFAGIASAMPVTMNFDGITNSEYVSDYYNGGQATILGLVPDGPNGPNFGVAWSGAVATNGNGTTPAPPSPPNFMAFANGVSATMSVTAGFAGTGFSFAYFGGGPTVSVYSGLDGTGSLLASQTLDSSLCGLSFCWQSFDFPDFAGIAKSVVYGGTGVFDNITFDMNPMAVPEPAELGMFAFGMLLIGLFAGFRRRLA